MAVTLHHATSEKPFPHGRKCHSRTGMEWRSACDDVCHEKKTRSREERGEPMQRRCHSDEAGGRGEPRHHICALLPGGEEEDGITCALSEERSRRSERPRSCTSWEKEIEQGERAGASSLPQRRSGRREEANNSECCLLEERKKLAAPLSLRVARKSWMIR